MPGHGTRARYLRGCKCAECREANRVYGRAYKDAAARGIRRTVPTARVLRHVEKLHAAGVEYRAIARAAECCTSVLVAIVNLGQERMSPEIARRILDLGEEARRYNSLAPIDEAARIVTLLEAHGVNRHAVAKSMGWSHGSFQVRQESVTRRTYRRLAIIAGVAGAITKERALEEAGLRQGTL